MQKHDEKSTPIVQGFRDFVSNKAIRHCKIIGTLGPASSSEEVLRDLILAGLNIARLNFSHGSHETHAKNIELIRKLSKETKLNVSILQDLQGPKIRCGELIGGRMELVVGQEYILTFGTVQEDPKTIPIDYKHLAKDTKVGQRVMMDDGLLLLEICSIKDPHLVVKVLDGGILKNRKGVNFPDSLLSLPAMTEKDNRDLLFGIANRVDMVALSFVQTPDDILLCKKIIKALGSDTPVIAKIEKPSAVERIDEIAKVADGLMVARGDLGVEVSVEKVPLYQYRIIDAAARQAKPVIIATQMLESMIVNPIASSAEVADVANGVLDSADCIMLSAEVASGKYPVACVRKMADIIEQVEKWSYRRGPRFVLQDNLKGNIYWEVHEAIARAACETADALQAKAIVCLTLTGSIANLISSWRPKTPIVAISPREDVIQRLQIAWGVYGMVNPLFYNTDALLADLPKLLKSLGIVNADDYIVITAGIPMNLMKSTNMIKISRVP